MGSEDRHLDFPYVAPRRRKLAAALVIGAIFLVWLGQHSLIGAGYRWSCEGCGATLRHKLAANRRALPSHDHTWKPAGGQCGCPYYFPCPFNLGEHDVEPVLRALKEDRVQKLLRRSRAAQLRFGQEHNVRFVEETSGVTTLSVEGATGKGTIEVVFDQRLVPMRGHILSEDGSRVDLGLAQVLRELATDDYPPFWVPKTIVLESRPPR
ncbi:MAG: hypothetical protein JKY65_13930 [Planctomycetes bacterium]|nr:hypothetical protein [Planctomycetota bacterium]